MHPALLADKIHTVKGVYSSQDSPVQLVSREQRVARYEEAKLGLAEQANMGLVEHVKGGTSIPAAHKCARQCDASDGGGRLPHQVLKLTMCACRCLPVWIMRLGSLALEYAKLPAELSAGRCECWFSCPGEINNVIYQLCCCKTRSGTLSVLWLPLL